MTSHVRTSRSGLLAGTVAALAIVLAACGSSSKSSSTTGTTAAGGSGGKVTLHGQGSTFQQTFNQVAIQGFQGANPNITVEYKGVGSGTGKTLLASGDVDFAGSDSPFGSTDPKPSGPILYFPTVAAPITVSYNASGLDKLQLSGPTLAKIFSQKIKTWDDAAIAADNPGVKLPSTKITVVRRAEKSGTTQNFTTFLSKAGAGAWTYKPAQTWPESISAGTQSGTGNSGVAQIVKTTNGAIGYVDYSDAVQSNLKFAAVKNSAGTFEQPTLDGASAAVNGATVKPDLTYDPINASGADAYPITSPTWIIVYQKQKDKATGDAMKAFLSYILNDGQKLASDAKYAPLPDSLKQKAITQLDQLQIPA
jgi:phosphate transport system substrate-binding protein